MSTLTSEDKISLYLFYALIITVPLFFDFTWLINKPLLYESFYLPKRVVFQALAALIFLYAIALTVRKGRVFYQANPLSLPILLFSAWGALSLFNSINIQVSLRYYPLFFSQTGLFFLTVYLLNNLHSPLSIPPLPRGDIGGLKGRREESDKGGIEQAAFIEKILDVLIMVSAISALIGILQFLGLNYEHGIKWESPKKLIDKIDVYSTYGNPNFMSSFLAAVFPLTLINLLHRNGNAVKRLIYIASGLIILSCILISRTKSAWLGVILSVILLFIFMAIARNEDGRPLIALKKLFIAFAAVFTAIIGFIMGIAFILPAGSNPIFRELSSLNLSHLTIKGRELMWGTTFNMINDHPVIGLGVNTFRLNYQNYQGDFLSRHPEYISYLGSAESPHNQFLEIASEQGIIGMLLFILINIIFFKKGLRSLSSEMHIKEKLIVIGIMCGVAGILVHGLAEFPLNLIPNAMLYWLYIALVMAIITKKHRKENMGKKAGERPLSGFLAVNRPSLIIIVSAAASLVFIWLSLRPLIASKIHRDAWHFMRDERWGEAIVSAKRGIKFDPLNDELHLFLGVANYHLKNYPESLKEYSKAYEIYPDYMIPYNIGLIHKKTGRLALAEEYFKKTIFLRPNILEPYTQLSQVYKEMGRIDESIEIINKGAKYRRF